MKRVKYLLTAVLVATLAACGTTSTVPLTGRQHKISVSDGELLSLSKQEYAKFMASAKKSTNIKNSQMVTRVGKRLATAVETYLRSNGYANEVNNFQWEFNLVQDKQANAFCMPGGKIVVFEGLLPYTQNEPSLAIVLGHEIAHAVAKHSAEQMTKKQNQNIGTSVLGAVLNSAIGSGVGDVASQVAGEYFTFQNLKYSRSNENEADYMGLIFAAMAGYDPQNAIGFWQRMAASSKNSTLEFFSSHPSDAKRVENIKKWMPEAMKYYKGNNTKKNQRTLHIR
ncbi:M48 family metallopeptidase [Prevotella brunnea]|uniref:M48 family metallopeptidase n=1 Tax=Prevotella brunnea TaxID=2508867 RepID=A0A5C8GL60_9BACT|nr:M48 family metallopeptidase [Prevotella brunnea]MDR0185181.1 M48 family metallopeptidase [Prevotella brunnea]TXJ62459.1 M48 family metallopeptidase [Prevotella brunnea]